MMGFNKIGKIGGDYFSLCKNNKGGEQLNFYLKQFKLSDYIIMKSTRKQKIITQEDLLDEKFARYIFFKKGLYNDVDIKQWLLFSKSNTIIFLTKPFPPIELLDKIKIIDNL